MEIVPGPQDVEAISAGIAAGVRGRNSSGTVQRLLDVANKVEQIAQAGGLISLRGGAALQVGNAEIDRLDDVKGSGGDGRGRCPVKAERQINVVPDGGPQRTFVIVC